MRIEVRDPRDGEEANNLDKIVCLIDEEGNNVLARKSLFVNNVFIKIKANRPPTAIIELYVDDLDVDVTDYTFQGVKLNTKNRKAKDD